MAIEVFNRYEKKYVIEEQKFNQLINRISEYMIPDEYNIDCEFYNISSIYFDTEDNLLIRNSIEKPVYKEKLRLRCYGVPSLDDLVYIEIKKKYKGLVNKRRTPIRLGVAYAYFEDNKYPSENPEINQQVLKEIDYFKNYYHVIPKVYISYDRRAFVERNNGDFRLTFDTNVRTRRDNLRLENGTNGVNLLEPGKFIMEIKMNKAVPLWFTRILSELNIYPSTFSKYGVEYKKYQNNMSDKGEQKCLNQFLQQHQKQQLHLVRQS